jgi:hypothetical protein
MPRDGGTWTMFGTRAPRTGDYAYSPRSLRKIKSLTQRNLNLATRFQPATVHRRGFQGWCYNCLSNVWFQRLLVMATLTALFADDLRIAYFGKWTDPYFAALAFTEIFIFVVEMILRAVAIPEGRCSWYILLDLMNLGSIFMDVVLSLPLIPLGSEAEQLGVWLSFQNSRASFRAGE